MATEDKWHDYAKEKPSEDMEGRDFIVSNGYSDVISMWCGGYWENEPFMGNSLCDEVVRWKSYLTPNEEKANEQTSKELKANHNRFGDSDIRWYNADDVDALLANKNAEIAELTKKLQNERDFGLHIARCADRDKEKHYSEVRRLCRALWLARLGIAKLRISWYKLWSSGLSTMDPEDGARQDFERWKKFESKCRAMADKYVEGK